MAPLYRYYSTYIGPIFNIHIPIQKNYIIAIKQLANEPNGKHKWTQVYKHKNGGIIIYTKTSRMHCWSKIFFFFLILKGSIRAFSSWHYYVQAISKVTDDNLQAILSTNNIFCVLFRVVIAGNDLLRYSKIVTSLQLKHKRSFICYLYCASTAWRLLNTINLFSIALPFLFSYRMYIKNVWLQQI